MDDRQACLEDFDSCEIRYDSGGLLVVSISFTSRDFSFTLFRLSQLSAVPISRVIVREFYFGVFCFRPTAKLSAEGLEELSDPTTQPPRPPTNLSILHIMTHLMTTEHEWWHKWHELRHEWHELRHEWRIIWHEWDDLTWTTWFDMNDMIWHEWHEPYLLHESFFKFGIGRLMWKKWCFSLNQRLGTWDVLTSLGLGRRQ
jgi:hypothetical protein